jgi:hypothetical protein
VSSPDDVVVQPNSDRRRGPRLNPSLVVGGVIVMCVVLMALVSFAWTPYDPTRVDATQRLLGSSAKHWFGTDKFGRDRFTQLLRRFVTLGLIPRANENGDALLSELTGCFQANAFVRAGDQCNFFGAHIVCGWFAATAAIGKLLIKL